VKVWACVVKKREESKIFDSDVPLKVGDMSVA
jgi:hypothetical protein